MKSNGLSQQSKPEVSKQLNEKGYIVKKKAIVKTNVEGKEYPSTTITIFGLKWRYEEEAEPEEL